MSTRIAASFGKCILRLQWGAGRGNSPNDVLWEAMMEMDIATTIAAAMTMLSPLIKKGAEGMAEEIGKSVVTQAGGLLKVLLERWRGKPGAEDAIRGFLRDPVSNREMLRTMLLAQVSADPELRRALERLVAGDAADIVVKLVADQSGQAIGMLGGEVEGRTVLIEVDAKNVTRAVGAEGVVFRHGRR